MFDNDGSNFNLSDQANHSTIGAAASWLGLLGLFVLAAFTAVHAINLATWNAAANHEAGDLVYWLQIAGVILVEVFAVATAIMLMTNRLRAGQKPAALAIELTWLVFAGLNLISSFALNRAGAPPAFVANWVTYGLPVIALVAGAEFWIMLRLNPDHKRAADRAEMADRLAAIQHNAQLELFLSPALRTAVQRATWLRLPAEIGRDLNLDQEQIDAISAWAPELMDAKRDGAAGPFVRSMNGQAEH